MVCKQLGDTFSLQNDFRDTSKIFAREHMLQKLDG